MSRERPRCFWTTPGDTADIEVVRDGTHILLEDLPRSTFTSADGSTYTGFGIYVGVGVQEATLAEKIAVHVVYGAGFRAAGAFQPGAALYRRSRTG